VRDAARHERPSDAFASRRGLASSAATVDGALVLFVATAGVLANGLRIPLGEAGAPVGLTQFLAFAGSACLIARWGLRREVRGVVVVLLGTLAFMAYFSLFHVDVSASLNRVGASGLRLFVLLGILVGMRRLSVVGRIRMVAIAGSTVLVVALVTQALGMGVVAASDSAFGIASSANGVTSTAGALLIGQPVGVVPGSEVSLTAGVVVVSCLAMLMGGLGSAVRGRLWSVAGAAVSMTAMIVAGTRIVPVAVLVALGVAAVHQLAHGARTRPHVLSLAVLVVVAVAAWGLVSAGGLMSSQQLQARWDRPDSSLGLRADIWAAAIVSIEHRPVAGWGPGQVPYALQYSGPGVSGKSPNAHNDILTWAAEWGVLVAFVYVGLLLIAGVWAWRLVEWWFIAFVAFFCVSSAFWPTLSNFYSADAFLFAVGFVAIAATPLPDLAPAAADERSAAVDPTR
jgi:hypothetical protein